MVIGERVCEKAKGKGDLRGEGLSIGKYAYCMQNALHQLFAHALQFAAQLAGTNVLTHTTCIATHVQHNTYVYVYEVNNGRFTTELPPCPYA